MNILQVTLGYPPAFNWGGPVKFVQRNSRELAYRGHQVTVICANLYDKKQKITPYTAQVWDGPVRVVYFNTWHIPWWPGTLGPIWLPELPKWIRLEIASFDIIHLHGYRNLMILPITYAARRAGVPFVVQPHGALPVIITSRRIKRLYDRLLGAQELRGLGALIALHERERQQALAMGVPAERIEVIPVGLEPLLNTQLPARGTFRQLYSIPAEAPLILFLGRINRKKGTDMLIEAFARLGLERARLVIAGPDDGQLKEVQQLIRKHGLNDRVVLTGLLTGPEVWSAYQDADLFVLPCRADTFPATVLEACRAGTPMVITDCCEIAPLIEGRVGEVTPFEAEKFALAMRRMLTDADLYQGYKANCAAWMDELLSFEATVDCLERLYAKVIAGIPGTSGDDNLTSGGDRS